MALEENLRIGSESDLAELDKAIDKLDDVGTSLSDIEDDGAAAERGTEKASGGLSSLVGWLGKAAGAIGALGLAAGIGGAIMAGVNATFAWSEALNTLQAQTGATAAQVEEYKAIGQDLYKSGWGEGVEDVVASLGTVQQISGQSGDQLRNMTENALAFSKTFGSDVGESVSAVDTLMTAFGNDSQEAFDLLAYTMQKTGDPAGDLLSVVAEFGPILAQNGYDIDEFFSLLNGASAAGIQQFSKVGDAAKEFATRTKAGGDEVEAAFDAMSDTGSQFFTTFEDGSSRYYTSFEDIQAAIADGSYSVEAFANQAGAALLQIEDPIERQKAAVALLGPMYEDLGDDLLLAFAGQDIPIDAANGAMDRMQAAMQSGLRPAIERLKRTGLTFLANFLEPFVLKVVDKAVPAIERLADFLENDAADAINEFADTIGAKAGPVVEDIATFAGQAADTIGHFADQVSEFVARNPMVLTYLQYFALALGVLVGAAVVIPAIIGAITAVLGGLGVALGVIFSPVMLIAVALAALGLAYQENLFGFADAVNEVAGVVGVALGRIKEFLGSLIDAFQQGGFDGAAQFIQDKLITPIIEAVRNVNWGEAAGALWANFKQMLGVALALVWQASVWVRDNLVQPMFDYLSNVNWGEVAGTLWSNFKQMLGVALALVWQASVWVRDNLVQPMFDYLSNVNWGEVAATLWSNFKQMLGVALALIWQAAVWVRENLVQPMFDALIAVNWGEAAATLWSNFKQILGVALALIWQASVWMREKVITPMVNAVTNVNWAGLITSVGDFGGSVFSKLKETLPDIGTWITTNVINPISNALSGLGGMVKGAINAAIPDDVGFDVGPVDLPSPIPDIPRSHIGVSIPNPFPGYAGGTNWTGSGNPMNVAGVVHQREAVVPEGGMRVYPSKNGLMLDGGGMAGEVVIPITLELDGRVIYATVKRYEGLRAT